MTLIKVKTVDDEDADGVGVTYSHIRVILSIYRQDKLGDYALLTPEEAVEVAGVLIACAKAAKANRK
jgi:hypothetical protein